MTDSGSQQSTKGPEADDDRSGQSGGLVSKTFISVCAISTIVGFVNAPFHSLLPVYIEADLGRSPLFTANLRVWMLVMGGIFAVVGGRLCDTLGRKPTLLLGLTGYALSGLVFRFEAPWALTFLIFFIGVAGGPWSTAGQSYLIGSVDVKRLGLGGALYFLSHTFGSALGNLATGLVLEVWTLPKIGLIMVVAMVCTGGLALLWLPGGRTQPMRPKKRPSMALWASYRPLLDRREVHLLIGLRYAITTFWGMATLLLPLLIFRASGSKSTVAYYASISLATAAVCQLLTGVWRDRQGRFWPVVLSSAGVGLCAFCLALYWQSTVGLFILGTALTSSAWALSTLVPSLIDEVATRDEKNRLVGLGHTVWSSAMVSGNLLGGLLIDLHPGLPFLMGGMLGTVGAICGWRLCVRLDSRCG